MAKQKQNKPIYVTDKNNPRLKSYQDSLKAYNANEKSWKGWKPLTKEILHETGADFPGNSYSKYIGNPNYVTKPNGKLSKYIFTWKDDVKKPTQPVVYQERTYQKENDPIKSKSIKGMDAKLPDLKKVEGPSKWMRSFGAGATENYWSKVDASGKALAGYNSPNKNAVEQPAGPGEDYQVRNSIPLGATQFNKDKK